MTEVTYTGVAALLTHGPNGTRWLKQYALLFDEVVFTDLGQQEIELIQGAQVDPQLQRDLEYLEGKEFIRGSEPYFSLAQERNLSGLSPDKAEEFSRMHAEFSDILNEFNDQQRRLDRSIRHAAKNLQELQSQYELIQKRTHAWSTRLVALDLRRFHMIDAVSLESIETTSKDVDRPAMYSDVFEIIIDNMPIADEMTPWEDLLAYSKEKATAERRRKLRMFIRSLIDGKNTVLEAGDQIHEHLSNYRADLMAAGFLGGSAALKTICVGGAEVIEAGYKLELAKGVKGVFELFDAGAQLAEAERKARGQELSLVAQASRKFQA